MDEKHGHDIALIRIFIFIKKKIWFIILITGLFAVFGGILDTFAVTKKYEASTEIIVAVDVERTVSHRITHETNLNLYGVLRDRYLLQSIIEKHNLDMSPSQIDHHLFQSVDRKDHSIIISLSYRDTHNNNPDNILASITQSVMEEMNFIIEEKIIAIDQGDTTLEIVSTYSWFNLSIASALGFLLSILCLLVWVVKRERGGDEISDA